MRILALILAIALSGCAGQVISIPVSTAGSNKYGQTTTTRGIPILKNTGNLANSSFHYNGPGGNVSWTADVVDNATATMAIGESTSSIVRSGGSVIGTTLAGATGLATAIGLTQASIAESNANSAASIAASEASTKQAGIAAKSGVINNKIAADAATKALRIDAAKAIKLAPPPVTP